MYEQWVAGVMEGEAYFGYKPKNNHVEISVQMVDEDVIRALQSRTGFGRIYGPYKRKDAKHQDVWKWIVADRESVIKLLKMVKPYMFSRRRKKIHELLTILYRKKNRRDLPTGVTRRGNKFKATKKGVHLGYYATAAEAESVYRRS